MTDDLLDPRIVRTLQAYASGGSRPIDAVDIASSAALQARGGRFGRPGSSRWPLLARMLLYVGLIGLLLLGGLLAYAGSRQRVPPPFGPAGNGLIAFSQNGDIYVGDPASGVSRPIMTGPDIDTAPFWSLDGTRLISLREVGGGMELVLTDADGGHPAVLRGGPFIDPVFAAWSPTGRQFAIVSMVEGSPRLWLVETDGSGSQMLAGDLAIESFAFRPPDGREILFRGQDSRGIGLYVMDADGSHRRTIVEPDRQPVVRQLPRSGVHRRYRSIEYWDLAEPRYSPDGTRIAYQHHSDTARVTRLHVANADGSNDTVLHLPGATFEGWPVWSPDGTRLIIIPSFSPFESWGTDAGWNVPYTIVRADGTGEAIQTGPPLPQAGAKVEWSPDGATLLMIPFFGDEHHLLLDANGGPPIRLPWDSDIDLTWQRLFSP